MLSIKVDPLIRTLLLNIASPRAFNRLLKVKLLLNTAELLTNRLLSRFKDPVIFTLLNVVSPSTNKLLWNFALFKNSDIPDITTLLSIFKDPVIVVLLKIVFPSTSIPEANTEIFEDEVEKLPAVKTPSTFKFLLKNTLL